MKHVMISTILAALTATVLLTGCGSESAATSSGSADSSSNAAPAAQDIGTELTIGVASLTAHAGDKAVPVSVNIWNNPGYGATGMQLIYDPALTPVKTGEVSPNSNYPFAKCTLGEAAEDFMQSCLIGEEAHLIAFGGMSTTNCTNDGAIFTVYFDIPADAKAGQQYTFQCNLDSLNTADKEKLTAATIEGTLTIE